MSSSCFVSMCISTRWSSFVSDGSNRIVFGVIRTLGSTADGASVAAHGDSLRLLLDVLKELDGALQLPAVDGLGGLAGVLERNTEVGTAGLGRLGRHNLGGGVANLFCRAKNTCQPFLTILTRLSPSKPSQSRPLHFSTQQFWHRSRFRGAKIVDLR